MNNSRIRFNCNISKHVIIFGIDMIPSEHIDSKGKEILVLDLGPTQGSNHTLTAET